MLNTYYVRGGTTNTNNVTNIDSVCGTIVSSAIDSYFFTCEIGSTMFNNLMGFNPHVVSRVDNSYTDNMGHKRYVHKNKDVPVKVLQSMILPNGHMMFEVIKDEGLMTN